MDLIAERLTELWDANIPQGLPRVPNPRGAGPDVLDLDHVPTQNAIASEIVMWANGNGHTAEMSDTGSMVNVRVDTGGGVQIGPVSRPSAEKGHALGALLLDLLRTDGGEDPWTPPPEYEFTPQPAPPASYEPL